jgi:carbohydrate binding protein with CBM35 domain
MPLKNRRSMFFVTILLVTAFLSQFAAADLLRFEAEYGLLGGLDVEVDDAVAGYSGTGYVTGFIKSSADPNDEMVTVTVYASSAGSHPLTIGYRSPYGDKRNQIIINGVFVGLAEFPVSTSFTELSYGNIPLDAGLNTLSFASYEGWMDIDYFEIDGLDRQAISPDPIHKSTQSAGITELCWTNPDAGPGDIITCDVYLGTTEPNSLLPDYGLTKIAMDMWGSCIEIPIEIFAFETYYWVVDCWDSNVAGGSPIKLSGPAWEFTTVRKPVILEAEDGLITDNGGGTSTDTSVAGYSGTAYQTLRAGGSNPETVDSITVSVFSASAGNYPLSIRYHEPFGAKDQHLKVNGVLQSTAKFPVTSYWSVLEYGDIPLDEGLNTITLASWWGYIYIDYFAVDGLDPAASSPDPAHLSTVEITQDQLCWTNPAANNPGDTITSDVYFGTDPNGVYLAQIATGTVDTCVTIPGSLVMNEDYYWKVNCWDPDGGGTPISRPGGLWAFSVGNAPPDPNAGPDQYTWLGKDGTPGQITVSIDARVTDDGEPSGTLTYLWEQVDNGAPTVVISPDDVEDISITFTATGFYQFELTASDGDLERSDSVYVGIGTTPCDAVQQNPYWWYYQGDINEDCYVDLKDFALLAADWLNCLDPAGCE